MTENEDNVTLISAGDCKNRHAFGSSMHLVMFVFFLAKTLQDTIVVNMLEKSTCLVIFNYTLTNCTDPVSPTMEGRLQQNAANLIMARSIIEAFFPSLLTLFIGPWSDTNGRRPLIMLSIIGYTISTIMWSAFSLVPGLHPLFFLLCSAPVAVCGGYVTFFLALYCYVSDVTEFDKRAFRMALLDGSCLGGVLISSFVTPYLITTSTEYGYTITFAVSALLFTLTYLYIIFYVDESVNINEAEYTRLWRFDHVKEIFSTCFKQRPNNNRIVVMLMIINVVLFMEIMDGEMAVFYMFTQKAFGWDLDLYTKFVSFFIVIAGISVPFVWFLSSYLKLPDLLLICMGNVGILFKCVLQAIATSGGYLYASCIFSVLAGLVTPITRSQLSKLIPAEDLGKIFAFTAFLESIAPLSAAPLYTFVYKATIDYHPNTVFWLSFGLSCVSMGLMGLAVISYRLAGSPPDTRPLLVDADHDVPHTSANVQA